MEYILVPGLLLSILALIGCTKTPVAAVFFIICATLVDTWFIKPVSTFIVLNIYLHDIVFGLLLIAALVRIVFFYRIVYLSPAWLIFGLLLFYGLFAGLHSNGTAAGVDFRSYFYYWVGTLYFISFSYSEELLAKIVKYWILMCLVLLAIVYFRFIADFLHLPISATWIAADTTGVRFRVVSAGTAYLLGAAVVIRFARYAVPEGHRDAKLVTALFILAVIALQHRSVWAATLFPVLSAMLLPGIKNTRIANNLAMLGIAGAILLVPVLYLGYADVFLHSVSQSAARATRLSEGTFGARVAGWLAIWDYWQDLPFFVKLFGEPFGGGYAGQKVFPHNFYIQNLLKTGMLGVALFIGIYVALLVKLFNKITSASQHKQYYVMCFLLLIGQMAFYIPYGTQPEHGIILGIAMSLARQGIAGTSVVAAVPEADTRYYLNTPESKQFMPINVRSSQTVQP